VQSAIEPVHVVYDEDWLIANHADELTPWTPLIAARQQFQNRDEVQKKLGQRFMLIPCCEWDFDRKFTRKQKNMSRFHTYLQYVAQIAAKVGYKVETESLRIPSTRNIAIVGRFKATNTDNSQASAVETEILQKAKFKEFLPKFREESQHRG